MSLVSKEQWQLAQALAAGRVSEKAFCESLSTNVEDVPGIGLQLLRKASDEHDADGVEFGLYLGHRFGFTEGHLPILLHLAGEDWHTQHENVVDGLARLRAPSSIATLYRTALARLDYLDYDEAFALGVKCIWALGSINSEEAVARLEDLLSCGNGILVENVVNQLSRLQDEAESDVLRAAARKALGAKNPKSGAL
jgi:PBS lyase HEAT-like repeat